MLSKYAGELQLGDPEVGINQTIGMGDADAGDGGGFAS